MSSTRNLPLPCGCQLCLSQLRGCSSSAVCNTSDKSERLVWFPGNSEASVHCCELRAFHTWTFVSGVVFLYLILFLMKKILTLVKYFFRIIRDNHVFLLYSVNTEYYHINIEFYVKPSCSGSRFHLAIYNTLNVLLSLFCIRFHQWYGSEVFF